MAATSASRQVPELASDDAALVSRALARDKEAFRIIMRRNNQRLYRIARGVRPGRCRGRGRRAGGLCPGVRPSRHLSRHRQPFDLALADHHQRGARPPAPAATGRAGRDRRDARGRDHPFSPRPQPSRSGEDDGAASDPAPDRTGDRQSAGGLPNGVHRQADRGDDHRGDGRAARRAAARRSRRGCTAPALWCARSSTPRSARSCSTPFPSRGAAATG